MKPRFFPLQFASFALLALASSARLAAGAADATEYPYVIAVDLGATEFAPGDNLVITALRGDRPHLEAGGHYLLEGTYTLMSKANAALGWSITSHGPSAPTPIEASANTTISKGTGTFRLTKTFMSEGWPHISFRVERHSYGGIYFGEQGVEATVLRKKNWSDFEPPRDPPAGRTSAGMDPTLTGNRAIMDFLGDPVPLPANLDARYASAGLAAEFSKVCRSVGLDVVKLAVDDSEFPCLVYGLLAGRVDTGKISAALGQEPGYTYAGATTGRTLQGATYFSFNLTPYDQYPRGQAQAVRRRLMVRLQMLAEKAQRFE